MCRTDVDPDSVDAHRSESSKLPAVAPTLDSADIVGAGQNYTQLVDFDSLDLLQAGTLGDDAYTDGASSAHGSARRSERRRGEEAGPPKRSSRAQDKLVSELCKLHPRLTRAIHQLEATAPGTPRGEQPVLVIYDGGCGRCARLARALVNEYGNLCSSVDMHDSGALYGNQHVLAGLPHHVLFRAGGVSAVLPSGVYISHCEEDSDILTWELDKVASLSYPEPLSARQIEEECFVRLGGPAPAGWREPSVLARIGRALAVHRFAVVDGVLPKETVQALLAAARALYAGGMQHGGVRRESVFDQLSLKQEMFTGLTSEPRQWSSRGNSMVFIGDHDTQAPCVGRLAKETDTLVSLLRGASPGVVPAEVSGRLEPVTLREDTMVAAYSGAARARYLKHLDDDRGAVLTALFYLNEDWRKGDGGETRFYYPGMDCNDVKAEVEPVANRLILFWSNEDNPHEVLSTCRDRYAMTIWYVDGPRALAGPDALSRLVCDEGARLNPVAPLSLKEALARSGHTGPRANEIVALRMQPALEHFARACHQCGRASAEGKFGSGYHNAYWYCTSCWSLLPDASAFALGLQRKSVETPA